jgi:hypothetical protein
MLLTLRLLFAMCILYVALVNFTSAGSEMHGTDKSYWGGRFGDAKAIEDRLGTPDKIDLLTVSDKDVQNYFSALSEAARVDDGLALMRRVAENEKAKQKNISHSAANTSSGKPNYNQAYVRALLSQANIAVFGCRLSDAEKLYQQIFSYDSELLGAEDARIARDLNNLGMVDYLIASTTTDPTQRKHHYEIAESNCLKSAKLLENQKSVDELSVLQNLSVITLELGDKEASRRFRTRAENLRAEIHPPAPVVVL